MFAYQAEPTSIADAAWEHGYLTAWELLRIAAWKSAKGLAPLSLNSESQITSCTEEAMRRIEGWRGRDVVADPETDWNGWREAARAAIGVKERNKAYGLLSLHGVNYPMASAILTILSPTVWPVIDKWAVQSVFGPQVASTLTWRRAAAYEVYARHLAADGAEAWGTEKSIHQLDQAAMNAAMSGHPLPHNWAYAALPAKGL